MTRPRHVWLTNMSDVHGSHHTCHGVKSVIILLVNRKSLDTMPDLEAWDKPDYGMVS